MFKVSGILSQAIKLSTLAEKQKQADTASQVDSFSEVDPKRAFPLDEMTSLIGSMKETVNKFPTSNLNPQLNTLSTELSTATPEKMSQILSFSNIDPAGFKASEYPLDIETLSGLGGAVKGLNNNLAGGCKAVQSALNSSTSLSDLSVTTLDIDSIGKSVISSIQGVSSQAKALALESAAPLSSIANGLSGSLGGSPKQFSGGDIESFLKSMGDDTKAAVKGLSGNIKSIASSIPGGFKSLADSASVTSECCKDLADTAKAKVDGIENQITSIDKKVNADPSNLMNIKKFLKDKADGINSYGSELNAKIKEANTVGAAKAAAQNNPEATPTSLESVFKNVIGKTNKRDDAKFKSKVAKSENATKKAAPILNNLQAKDAANEAASLAAGRQHADKPTLIAETKKYNEASKIYELSDVDRMFYEQGAKGFSPSQFQVLERGIRAINKMPVPNMRKLAFDSLKVNTKMLQRDESRVFWYGLLYYPWWVSPTIDKDAFIRDQEKKPPEKRRQFGSHWAEYGCGFFFEVVEFNLKAWQHSPNSNRGVPIKEAMQFIPKTKQESDNTSAPYLKTLEEIYPLYEKAISDHGGVEAYVKANPGAMILLPPETWLAYKGYAINGAVAQKLESYGLHARRINERARYWVEPAVFKGVNPLNYVNKNGTLNYDAVNELIGSTTV